MYCAACHRSFPKPMAVCDHCMGLLEEYELPFALRLSLEKHQFLFDALRKQVQSGVLTEDQYSAVTEAYQSEYDALVEEASQLYKASQQPTPVDAQDALAPVAQEPTTEPPQVAPLAVQTASSQPITAEYEVHKEFVADAVPPVLHTDEAEVALENQETIAPEPTAESAAIQAEEPPIQEVEEDHIETTPPAKEPLVSLEDLQSGALIREREAAKQAEESEEESAEAWQDAASALEELQEQGTYDPLEGGAFDEYTEHSKETEYILKESAWSKYLRPFLVQNWLYFLGTFLVLASGFYLLSLAWEGMADTLRQSVIWGGLGTASLAFAGGGTYLHRKLGVEQAGQIFWLVGIGLVGPAAIAAGRASTMSIPIYLALMGGTLGLGWWLTTLLKRFSRGSLQKLTSFAITSQLFLIGLVTMLKQNEHARLWIFSFFYIGGLLLWQAIRHLPIFLEQQRSWASVIRMPFAFRRPATEEPTTANRWDWILFIGPIGYMFVLLLVWSGLELSTVLQSRMALSWYGPLLVLIGAALMEIAFLEPSQESETEAATKEAEKPKQPPLSGWAGGALAISVVGLVLALPHPPTQFWSGILMAALAGVIAFRWPRQPLFLIAVGAGLVGYHGTLRVLSLYGLLPFDETPFYHGRNGLLYIPFLGLLFAGVLWLVKRNIDSGVKAFRMAFLVLSLWFFWLMVSDAFQHPFYLLWGVPIYAFAYLAIGEVNKQKGIAYIGLLMTGLWFGFGPSQWISLDSRYVLALVACGLCFFGLARLAAYTKENSVLREAFDDGFLLLIPVLIVFWSQDPLFRFLRVNDVLTGASGGPWAPTEEWMVVYLALALYGLCMVWIARLTGSRILAYLSILLLAVGAGLLGIAIPRWLGRTPTPWRAPMFALIGGYALFVLSQWLKTGAVATLERQSLFNQRIESERPAFWNAPLRQFSYGLLAATFVLMTMRDLTTQLHLLFAYGIAFFLVLAGSLRNQRRFGYLLGVFAWYLGFLQLSWFDEWFHIPHALGLIIFYGGGCLVLSICLLSARRWLSSERLQRAVEPIVSPLVNLLPIYLLGASAWLVTQSIDWIMGQHEAPAVLFVGWMMLTLCFYIVAALIRHPVFVYTGAMSMMGMFLLMFQGVWDPLHLFVIGTGLIATCYAVGTLGLWKRYASATPAYEAALWSVWKPGSRQEGRALWGKSHRELGLWLALVSCFVNAFIWALSVYIRGGESILELRAVSPLFTLVSLLCCSLPFLWEARRKSRRSWIFHTGNVILGLAFTLGSLSLFEVNRESFLHATTWIKMTGIGALVLQVIYLLFAKVVAPRVKSTEHQHNVASAFLSSLNEAFRIYAFGAVVLFVLVATQQESIDTTLLLCLLAPLVLTQFSSADAFGLLAAGVVAAFGWSYGVLVPWWGIGILGLSGSLYLLALRSHWAASTGNKKHLGVPAWLMIAAAIAGSAAQLVPFGTSDTGIAASWCMGLGLAALITQLGLWVLRRISPSFDTSFGAGGILISKFKINGTPTVSMAFWHVLQFSFLVIALLGVAFSLVAMESLGTHMHWSVCLLPFAIALPLFFELAQQPHKFGIVLAVIATSLGVYFTFGQPWRGTDQQLMLPVYILLILWLAGLLVTKQLTKTKQSANSGEEQSESDESLPTNKHQALFVFSRQLFWLLTAPTLGIGCVIWLFALWETVFGVALLTHAASYERFLFAGIWGTIGVPLVYVWAHQQFRKGWSLFVLMLVLVAWPPALVGWLHYGLGLPRLTPAIGWAALVLFSGVFVYRIGQTTKSTWNGSVHPELRQLSVWTSIFGILSFLTLLATTSSRLWGVGAVQWLCIAGLVTIGWMLVAIRRMDSVKWMLQGTLALVWTIHGLIILTLPSYYGSFKYPALFALLLMLAVIVCYRLAHAAKQGRFAKWTEPLWHDAPDQEEALARLNERIAKNFVHVNFLISVCASLLVGYAWVGSATHLISIERFLIIPVLGLLAWSWVAQALSSKRDLWAYFGVFSALALYGYLRSAFGIGTRHMDAWVLLIIGFASTGLRMIWQKLGGELLQRVMFRTSFALPVLVWILNTTMGTPMPPGIWIMSGLYYGVVAYQYEKKWLFVPALLFGNIEVFSVLSSIAHADPFKQPQWYALSFGASLFAFIGIYHKDLAPKTRTTLRNIGTFVIYLSSMYQVLFLNNIFDIIVLAVLAIAGVFAGIMFHIRSYLYLGALFLVLNIVVNLFRIGIQDRVIGMVFLFVTGLLLLVSAVYFNLKRDELLKTYTEWREKVSEWEG